MSQSEQISVTRVIDAAPEQVFAVLTDPSRHTELDASEMLREVVSGSKVTGVGDEFVMAMENKILGEYQVRNRVYVYEQDRRIGWVPLLHPEGAYDDKLGGMKAGGHTFTWELEPTGSGQTKVTQVYDWSNVPDPGFKSLFPLLDEAALTESVERVGRAAG